MSTREQDEAWASVAVSKVVALAAMEAAHAVYWIGDFCEMRSLELDEPDADETPPTR